MGNELVQSSDALGAGIRDRGSECSRKDRGAKQTDRGSDELERPKRVAAVRENRSTSSGWRPLTGCCWDGALIWGDLVRFFGRVALPVRL